MQLHPLELFFPLCYLILLLWIGFQMKGEKQSESDYIVGGRRLTLPAFIATLVTTWYGGILGVGEFTFLYGISNWFVFGLPYYFFAIAYAIFLAPRIRTRPGLTIPDQVSAAHGSLAGKMSAVCAFFMTLPAPYMVMLGLLISWITGWNLTLSIALGTLFSMAYLISGGFKAVVRTDKLQFLLMFAGFAVLVFTVFFQYGGVALLSEKLPATHFQPSGGNSAAFILVWYFIAIWTFVDPGFHQRCSAAESPQTARKGIFYAIVFWFVFDLMTTVAGLYARALLPELEQPALSFPALGHEVLHPLAAGLFLTGLLATIMSTIDSFTLLSSISLGYDLLGKNGSSLSKIRLGIVVTAVVSMILAATLPSVIDLWYVIGTLFIPPMLLPLLTALVPRFGIGVKIVQTNFIVGFALPFIWLLAGISKAGMTNPEYPLGWQPMFPGLAFSLLLFIFGLIKKHRQTAHH
ncbi:MAG: hypothetical protein CSA81_01580 [Acidobacteria bacterium]|nr:MAG: hypothetical protein CSA81_01580 [Acidobacteriota bacterium]